MQQKCQTLTDDLLTIDIVCRHFIQSLRFPTQYFRTIYLLAYFGQHICQDINICKEQLNIMVDKAQKHA